MESSSTYNLGSRLKSQKRTLRLYEQERGEPLGSSRLGEAVKIVRGRLDSIGLNSFSGRVKPKELSLRLALAHRVARKIRNPDVGPVEDYGMRGIAHEEGPQ